MIRSARSVHQPRGHRRADPLRPGGTLDGVDDFAALLDAHTCAEGCSRYSHAQAVLLSPEDVASVAAEVGNLSRVRDLLQERGLIMLEGEPTPRFDPDTTEPKTWWVRYESHVRAPARRRRWFSRG
jgi:hypothetical protein